MQEVAKKYAELEINLDRVRADAYQVELRFTNPLSEAQVNPVRGDASFDLTALLSLHSSSNSYGKALASMLFSSEPILSMYRQVMTSVQSMSLPLRVRLLIGPGATELADIRWELLADPDSGVCLFTSEHVLFSRFMTSQDWRTVRLPPKAEIKALIAVAAPSDSADYQLAAIDVAGEVARAREHLKGIAAVVLGQEHPLTLASLLEHLRERVDILYLVCHGGLTGEGPHLVLQKDDGEADKVMGRDFAQRLSELPRQPGLVVLASCESAGRGSGSEAPDSLAQLLAGAGVPAIVAMRGRISMETVKQMLPVFFRELIRDGQVDRAMAVARSVAVTRNRPDFWMPAVYLRLRGGRIWYEPGAAAGEDFERIGGSGRRLFMTVAVIGLLAILVIAAAVFKDSFLKPKPVQENTEIVLDRSEAMNAAFDGGTKLAAAVAAAQEILQLVAASDNLALRQFGGPCEGENTKLAVKFGQNNIQRLRTSLGKLAAEGQSSLAHAVIEATGDFNDTERFTKSVSKRIVVITGSGDSCLKKDPIPAIKERLERAQRAGAGIEMDFRFIGLGLSPEQQASITRIADATKGKATFVDRSQDLKKELRRALVVERVTQSANAVVESLNAGMGHLNCVLDAIGRSDFSAAEGALKQARGDLSRSEASFDAMGQGDRKEQFKRLYETAQQNRSFYSQMIALAETMLSQAKAENLDGYNASRSEYVRLKTGYNRNVEVIAELLNQM